jgi:hypothetical protein
MVRTVWNLTFIKLKLFLSYIKTIVFMLITISDLSRLHTDCIKYLTIILDGKLCVCIHRVSKRALQLRKSI